MYNECYKDGNIEVYVEKVVNVNDKEGEWVSVEKFFNENYERLCNGEEIRKELERIENGMFNGEEGKEGNEKDNKETEEDMEEKLVL
jgi:ribonuclease HI